MSVAELAAYVHKSASHHPLMTAFFAVFLGVTLLLGLMNESLLAGEVSIVFVQRFKREAGELMEVGKRLKKELTTWDEPKREDHGHPAKPPEVPREKPHAAR